jgi:nitrogen regulatory protein P-II 1
MHKIEIVVRRFVAELVRNALAAHGVEGFTMTDTRSAAPRGTAPSVYRGTSHVADVLQTKIEAIVADADVDSVVEAIAAAARGADVTDGRILVVPIAGVASLATLAAGVHRDRTRRRPSPVDAGLSARAMRMSRHPGRQE